MTFDRSVDAAYLYLQPEIVTGCVARTVCVDVAEVGGMINLDLDDEGRVIGVEVLDAGSLLPRSLLDQLGVG